MVMNSETALDRPLRDLGLWLGMVGPAVLWLIQFQILYMLVYPACDTQKKIMLHLTSFGFAIVIAALGIWPLLTWRRTNDGQSKAMRTRRFMAGVGIMTVSLFLLAVIAQWIAAIIVDPCPM